MERPPEFLVEFREHAVDLVRALGRPRAEITRSVGLSDCRIRVQVHRMKADAMPRKRVASR